LPTHRIEPKFLAAQPSARLVHILTVKYAPALEERCGAEKHVVPSPPVRRRSYHEVPFSGRTVRGSSNLLQFLDSGARRQFYAVRIAAAGIGYQGEDQTLIMTREKAGSALRVDLD